MQTCDQALHNAYEARERLLTWAVVAYAAVAVSGTFAWLDITGALDGAWAASKHVADAVAALCVVRCLYLLWSRWRAEQVLARAEL